MLEPISIAPNVTLYAMQTDKFKTACFSVNFIRPHEAATAELDALLPSVLLRATQRWPDIRAISTRLDELYGASFGTLLRRKGEVKLLGFYADFVEEAFLPEGAQVFAPMLEFLEEVLYHPLTQDGVFCPDCVEGEKQNLINAIESSLNDKRSYAVTQMLRLMCAGEAYGVPRLGEAEGVRAITPERLWAHYRHVLATAPLVLFYAGRQTPQAVAAQFSALFAGRAAAHGQGSGTQVIRRAAQTKQHTQTMNVTQGKLILGLRTGITVSDPDWPALLLLNAVLGGGMQSKLFLKVREELSLCYFVGSTLEKYKGIMVISAGIDFDREEQAKAAILSQLDECRAGHITGQELDNAKAMLRSSLRAAQDSPVQLDEFYTGLALAGGDDLPVLMQRLQALTAQELAAAAEKLSLDTVYFLKGVEA